MKNINSILIRTFAVIALVITLAINALAEILPLNGKSTGEISNSIEIFFAPAGYVFSIWSVIYLALIAFVTFQLLPNQLVHKKFNLISAWFIVSCIANITWMFLWHYEYIALSVVAMLTLLISLIAIYLNTHRPHYEVKEMERWFAQIPFSIYLGWISIATIANISAALVVHGWGGWGLSGPVWSVILISCATLLTLTMLIKYHDITYALVIAWATIGIIYNFSDVPTIAISHSIAVAIIVSAIVLCLFVHSRKNLHHYHTNQP